MTTQRHVFVGFALSILLLPRAGGAVPAIASASDTVDDATLTLAVSTQRIIGDDVTRCEVSITVTDSDVAFTAGDAIDIEVWEDDTTGDDLIFSTNFVVTAGEISAGLVDRTFSCGDTFPDADIGPDLEVYASAVVTKDACGLGCFYDRPQTVPFSVALVTDDAAEEDDDSGAAVTIGASTPGRICADDDWAHVTLTGPTRLTLDLVYPPEGGRLDAVLESPPGTTVATATDTATGGSLADIFPMGDYYLRVSHRAGTDFNFYDIAVASTPVDCVPGTVESEACGTCGTRERTCDGAGAWGAFGACMDDTGCEPDAGAIDAGTTDAGITDAGAIDAGPDQPDAGSPASPDADTTPPVDAGETGGGDDDGCSCRVATRSGRGRGALGLLALAGVALVVIRRRRFETTTGG